MDLFEFVTRKVLSNVKNDKSKKLNLLKDEQFHYGIGREKFPALLKPSFESVREADSIWADSTRFLLAYSGKDVKAYSIKDLTRHEVVNDVLNGKPIMAAYCILADLGAIYERNYFAPRCWLVSKTKN